MTNQTQSKMTSYRWVICSLLFFATTVNYLDRQVLSLTWEDFIRPEFHWTNTHYGLVTGIFSLVYALANLFAGRIVDILDTKKGYMWSIGVWSVAACAHALCGVITEWVVGLPNAEALRAVVDNVDLIAKIANVSLTLFIIARCLLAFGEAGNFPAAIKATAEYFPKKDRAYATSIFNAGSTIGALLAPFTIPVLAAQFGWEAAFIIIGALGFVWMGFWQFMYKKPNKHPKVNAAELAYINSDNDEPAAETTENAAPTPSVSIWKCFSYRQTWAFLSGKILVDGVWWFYLFWMPSYLKNACGMSSTSFEFQLALGILYLIVMISLVGGYLPTIFIDKYKMDPYAGRMRAMLIFAFFPLLALMAQPLAHISYWFPVIIVGIAGAAHQSWSANIFSTVGDMFPKSMIATVVGIGGMAGGAGSFLIQTGAGKLFDYTEQTNMTFLGYTGIEAGYMIAFSFCAVAYLISWIAIKSFVPKYKPIEL